MAYLNNIPADSDILAISQGQILQNFSQLQTQFSVDHDSLLAAGATGKHLKLTMPDRAADATTGANEGALYTKNSGSQTELYFREENNGDVVQITSNGGSGYVRAFCSFLYAAATPFSATGTGYNVGVNAIVRNSAGNYTVTFTNALPSADYTVTGAADSGLTFSVISKTAASVRVDIRRGDNNAFIDGAANFSILQV